ncbi:MAG: 50S ribosomal protein L20 [Candidatus Dormibacteria bacterium]
MARVKRGVTARARHKKVLRLAEGMGGSRHRLFKPANEAVMHSLSYAYRDRKQRKGDMRALWIARINAGARQNGLPYNQLMHGLKGAGIDLNRKMLADLAVQDSVSFAALVEEAKAALAANAGEGAH